MRIQTQIAATVVGIALALAHEATCQDVRGALRNATDIVVQVRAPSGFDKTTLAKGHDFVRSAPHVRAMVDRVVSATVSAESSWSPFVGGKLIVGQHIGMIAGNGMTGTIGPYEVEISLRAPTTRHASLIVVSNTGPADSLVTFGASVSIENRVVASPQLGRFFYKEIPLSVSAQTTVRARVYLSCVSSSRFATHAFTSLHLEVRPLARCRYADYGRGCGTTGHLIGGHTFDGRVAFEVLQAAKNSVGITLIGTKQLDVTLPFGCKLLADPTILLPFRTDRSGRSLHVFPLPRAPVSFHVQDVHPRMPSGVQTSHGVRISCTSGR